jgi:multiple sugar transport system ATP-binding protein
MVEEAPLVAFRGVAKSYGDTVVLRGADLAVVPGDFMVVYGPPASGKTVLMRLLMGLEHPTAGQVWLRGEDVTRVPAADRNIGYVPQSFALYPHLSVHDNIAYPLKLAGVPGREAEPIVRQAAEMLKISDLLGKRPDQLSGGQKQRVAIARGIAKQTEVFVLDDPLAGLDFKLREQLVDDLKNLQQTWNATFLYTTSDAIEALTLADHLAVLANGVIAESGAPEQLYDAAQRAETMHLLGFPRANLVAGTLTRRTDGELVCVTDLFEFPVTPDDGGVVGPVEQAVTVGLRPEAIALDGNANGATATLRLPARVLLQEDLGGEEIVYLDARGTPLTTVLRHDAYVGTIPDETTIVIDPRNVVVFGADGARIGRGLAASHV